MHEFSPFLHFFWLPVYLFNVAGCFCSVLSLPYLGHLRAGQLNHTRKAPRGDIPSLALDVFAWLLQSTVTYPAHFWPCLCAQLIISKVYIYIQEQIMHMACE